MNRRIFTRTLVMLMFLHVISNAQEIISSSGNHFSSSNLQISWTLGETVIETVSNTTMQLTQGFHQSNLIITAVDEIPGVNIDISAYPNPTTNFLNLKIENRMGEKIYYTLYDMDGKILATKLLESDVSEIPMYNYAPATYFLKITGKTQALKTFKIIKK